MHCSGCLAMHFMVRVLSPTNVERTRKAMPRKWKMRDASAAYPAYDFNTARRVQPSPDRLKDCMPGWR